MSCLVVSHIWASSNICLLTRITLKDFLLFLGLIILLSNDASDMLLLSRCSNFELFRTTFLVHLYTCHHVILFFHLLLSVDTYPLKINTTPRQLHCLQSTFSFFYNWIAMAVKTSKSETWWVLLGESDGEGDLTSTEYQVLLGTSLYY